MADNEFPKDFQRRSQCAFCCSGNPPPNRSVILAKKLPYTVDIMRDIFPKSDEELAIWNDLASPTNNEALHRYVEFWSVDLTEYAKELYDALVADSDRRSGRS